MCVKQTTSNTNSTTKIQPCPKKFPPHPRVQDHSNSPHTKASKPSTAIKKKKRVYEESGLLSDGQTAGLCGTSSTEREVLLI